MSKKSLADVAFGSLLGEVRKGVLRAGAAVVGHVGEEIQGLGKELLLEALCECEPIDVDGLMVHRKGCPSRGE